MQHPAATYQEFLKLQQARLELRQSYIQRDMQIEQAMESLLADLSPMFIDDTTTSPCQPGVMPTNPIPDSTGTTPESPCLSCNKHTTCKKSCDKLNAMLPKISEGSGLISSGLGDLIEEISDTQSNSNDQSYLKAINRERAELLFAAYQNCPVDLFRKREWEVVTLRIKEGYTYKEIGLKLGIGVSTASDAFRRAKKKMENHYVTTRKKA